MAKTLLEKVSWFIPIKKIRDLFRNNAFFVLDIDHWLNYRKYKKTLNYENGIRKPTFFVRNDFTLSSDEFSNNGIFSLIKHRFLNDLCISFKNPDIELFGPVGPISYVKKSKAKIKIFLTGEYTGVNALDKLWTQYYDNLINDVDISLAFSHIDEDKHENYIRHPFWISSHFGFFLDDNITKDNIQARVDEINNANYDKSKFASLIARHDKSKLRGEMFNRLSTIDFINAPGKFLHNDESLKLKHNNDKHEYLKKFKFNICPENAIYDGGGYITEKIFDAMQAGCIPIYAGDKNLEEGIINKEAVLYWNTESDNEGLLKEVEKLHKNDKLYASFVKQKRLFDYTTDYIWQRRIKILARLEKLIEEKIKI